MKKHIHFINNMMVIKCQVSRGTQAHDVGLLDKTFILKEGVLSWRLRDKKKWSVSFVVVSKTGIAIYRDTEGIKSDSPQLR